MKLFYMDCGYMGCIAVWASDTESARNLMKDCPNYDKDQPIVEKELTPGIIICNLGDM